ncbi:tetratricopeptide (TPR) repeat protein [Streptomyces sp. V4I8]|uniref:hypothetical protein n=1 Tax=Streptomyces sp. V4I8 TaxID=3156469 RepID=UPI0035168917
MPKAVVTPQQRFADWLAQLRDAAGRPSYTRLLAHNRTAAATLRGKLSRAGISILLNGNFVLPPRPVVLEAFVDACRACALEDHGVVRPEVARHLGRELWRGRHSWLVEALDPLTGRGPAEPAQASVEDGERAVRDAVDDRPPFTENTLHDRYGATRGAFERYHSVVLDREQDLRALLDAVHGPGAYHVIEAPAFAGKTAFMVELYRRLRAQGCPTAVFYVVDRFANRAQDFLEAVVGQLIDALPSNEVIAAPEERPAQFTRLWSEFTALGTAERPAVLLVDALDEQLGTDGISQLLPVHLSGRHAHVVVATRSLPDFRAAVPRHHALATSLVSVVPLTPSPHAEAKSDDAHRHLADWLSSSDPVPERIATLLCVAEAPLTRHDLADLLGLSVGQIARHLHGVERCLLPLAVEAGGMGYQWAHVTYGGFVDEWVGGGRYAQEVHHVLAWAERHAERGWPETTPPFLLHGLHQFLRTHRDLAGRNRLVELVTTTRRQRLLATYGHDGMFLETIAWAREEVRETGGDSTDALELLFKLGLHQVAATAGTAHLPKGLLGLLVRSGQRNQAEGIALCVEERYRARAMAEVAEALVDIGAGERAAEIAYQAWKFAPLHQDPYWQLDALQACARAARRTGAAVAPPTMDSYLGKDDQRLHIGCAKYFLELGEPEQARAALDRLFTYEQTHAEIYAWALADAAAVLGALGDLDAAVPVLQRALAAEQNAFSYGGGQGVARIGQVVRALVRAGRVEEAAGIAASIKHSGDYLRANVHGMLIDALLDDGGLTRAEKVLEHELGLAESLHHDETRLVALMYLRAAQAHGGFGDVREMERLVQAVDTLDYPEWDALGAALVALGEGFLAAGRQEEAVEVARQALAGSGYEHLLFLDGTLKALITASIEAGDFQGARRAAEAEAVPHWREDLLRLVEYAEAVAGRPLPASAYLQWPIEELARLAVALTTEGGNAPLAHTLAYAVMSQVGLVDHLSDPFEDRADWAAALLALEVLQRIDGVGHWADVAAGIRSATHRAEALATLSRCCRATDVATADTLLRTAVETASRLGDRDLRVSALCAVLTAAGSLTESHPCVARALTVLRQTIGRPTETADIELRASTAVTLSRVGLREQARRIALDAYEIYAATARPPDGRRDGDGHRLCDALTDTGLYDKALDLAESLAAPFQLAGIAKRCTEAGDRRTAGRAAEQAHAAWLAGGWGSQLAESLISALLDAGRADLATSLFLECEDDAEGDEVVHVFFRGLVMNGHASEALSMACGLKLISWRAAALVGWCSAPTWPPEMRRRLLRLLQDLVMSS